MNTRKQVNNAYLRKNIKIFSITMFLRILDATVIKAEDK